MSSVFASAELVLLAAFGFALLAASATALVVRRCADHMATWSPTVRHRGLALLCAAPAVLAVMLLLSALLPSLVALVVPAVDHCTTHDDGHAHLCFVHLPAHGTLP